MNCNKDNLIADKAKDKSGIIIGGIILLIFFLMFAGTIGYEQYIKYQKRQERHESYVKSLYRNQNKAFGIDSYNENYLDQTHINEKECHTNLLAYKFVHSEAEITVDDVRNYLSDSEYDEKGKLRVENRPENIENYIRWYIYEGGKEYAGKYERALKSFYEEQTGKEYSVISENDIETIDKISNDLLNCPSKEQYITLTKEQRAGFVDESTASLIASFLDGTGKVTYSPSMTIEKHNASLMYFEEGKEYTYSEIQDNIASFLAQTGHQFNPDKTYDENGYLDCGLDGRYEYCFKLRYLNSKSQYFIVKMIMRNNDNHLSICFACDNYSENLDALYRDIDIRSNGVLICKVIEDEKLYDYYYYLNEEGQCSYLYHESQFGQSARGLLYISAGDEATITAVHPNGDEVTFSGHSFTVKTFYDPTSDTWYAYSFTFYDNNDKEYDTENEEYQKLLQFCKDEGYTVLADNEDINIKQTIRDSFGLSYSIFNHYIMAQNQIYNTNTGLDFKELTIR